MESDGSAAATSKKLARQRACPQCDENLVVSSFVEQDYVYGAGDSAIKLKVEIPVHSCNQCELTFTDWEAEEIKHDALCRHFGVLNPNEIRQLRKKHKMTRTAFAQFTGLGEATLSRWEKGVNIQSVSHDRYLRLLNNDEIMSKLRQIVSRVEASDQEKPDTIDLFPRLKNSEQLMIEQRLFELRASH